MNKDEIIIKIMEVLFFARKRRYFALKIKYYLNLEKTV